MKTLVEMSSEHFDRLLAKSAVSDREYEILKNGVVTDYGEKGKWPRTVVILCDPADAKLLLNFARRVYPVAYRQIRQYPAGE
jgi:hypothetical protein